MATHPERRLPGWVRPALLVATMATLWAIAWSMGWLDGITVETVRDQVQQAGPWGILLFFGGACAANLLQIPGMVVIVGGIVAFGDVTGILVAWTGASLAASTTFALSRWIGGSPLGEVRHPWARKLLGGLEQRPFWTVAVLRTFMQNSPILNTALAFTPIRFGQYAAGSAVGLWIPVLAAALFTSFFL